MRLRLAFALLSLAASSVYAGGFRDPLEEAVRSARTIEFHPQATPPAWMDWERLSKGHAFLSEHRETVMRTLIGSSLASTFAAKDVAPVLMETGKLAKSFTPRMMATGLYVNSIVATPKDREGFVTKNYAQAVSLGELHREVAEGVRPALGWDPKVRVPMNAQSYAFVLYSFAWWPIEAMIATKEIDRAKDAAGIDGWFHLWSVVGHGMGVPDALLPMDYPKAKVLVTLLRNAQYAKPGEPAPEGVPVLLGGHVRMLAGMAAAREKKPVAEVMPDAARGFAQGILLSPGLAQALGLGNDPTARLTEYASIPAPKDR